MRLICLVVGATLLIINPIVGVLLIMAGMGVFRDMENEKDKEMTKVLEFPKDKVVREVPEEHKQARRAKMEKRMADSLAEDATNAVLEELNCAGIDIDSTRFVKDFILVADSIKACVYREYGLEHHLHEFVDENVQIIHEDLSGLNPEEIKAKIENVIGELMEAKNKLGTEEIALASEVKLPYPPDSFTEEELQKALKEYVDSDKDE